ncbi:MAG: hypothetical protein V1846_05320 [Candidatus Komeilibacteria bacterium]
MTLIYNQVTMKSDMPARGGSPYGRKSEYITKDYFDAAMREYTWDIIGHFNKSQAEQNKRVDKLEIELKKDINGLKETVDSLKTDVSCIQEVLMDYINTDKTVVTLVHELEDDHHLALPKTGALLAR